MKDNRKMDEAKTNICICQNASNSQFQWALERFFRTPPPLPKGTPDLKFGGPAVEVENFPKATPTPPKIAKNTAEEVPGDLQDILEQVFLDEPIPEPFPGGLTTGFNSMLEEEALLEIEPACLQLEQPETPATADRKRTGAHCDECWKVCRSHWRLVSHKCGTDEFKCGQCRYKGTCQNNLKCHVSAAHKLRGEWSYK